MIIVFFSVKCKIILFFTLDFSVRGEKVIDLKVVADDALKECRNDGLDINMCIVVKNKSAESGCDSPKQKKAKTTSVSFIFIGAKIN